MAKKIIRSMKGLWKDEASVTAIEYGLIAALIAVIIITAVALVGTDCNRQGIGATVRIGDQVRPILCGDSYLSCSPAEAHFGLKTAQEIQVRWPCGKTQVIRNVPVRSRVLITEGRENTNALTKREQVKFKTPLPTLPIPEPGAIVATAILPCLSFIGNEDKMRLACCTKVEGDIEVQSKPPMNLFGDNFFS